MKIKNKIPKTLFQKNYSSNCLLIKRFAFYTKGLVGFCIFVEYKQTYNYNRNKRNTFIQTLAVIGQFGKM